MKQERKSDSRQTTALVGIALIVLAAVMIFYALNMPRVYEKNSTADSTALSQMSRKAGETEAVQSVFPVNINTATVKELVTVEGIGEAKARAIIEYREYLGGYTSVEQIMDIKGFGQELYRQISPYLTV